MYDGGKILAGVIIGVILLTFPIWWTHGSAPPKPEVKLPEKETTSIYEASMAYQAQGIPLLILAACEQAPPLF